MTYELVDIGVNLTDRAFDADRQQVLLDAQNAGVTRMVITGTNLAESHQASDLCDQLGAGLWSTAGVHPHHAKDWQEHYADDLIRLSEHPRVVAIGETGLDFNRNFSPPEQQIHAFDQQLRLASELGLPLFLHERDAHFEQIKLLQKYKDHISGGVIHCFTGSREQLENYLELGLYVGITGWILDERRGQHLQELIQLIPQDKLLLETDCPYLLPRTLQPKPKSRRNEPKYLAHINDQIATLLNQDPASLALCTTQNAQRLFGLYQAN
jgi:TatD DNase family protein